MITAPPEDVPRQSLRCAWPLELFGTHRDFNREAENKPYIHWLQDIFDHGVEASEGSEDEDEDDEGDEDDEIGNEEEVECESQEPPSIDYLQPHFEYFDAINQKAREIEVERLNEDKKDAPCKKSGITRIFMEGMIGEADLLPYHDQVEVVAGFAEQPSTTESEEPVALLDDRKSGAVIAVRQRDCRPYRGPLSSKQLYEELMKQVAGLYLFSFSGLTNKLCSASRLTRIRMVIRRKYATRREESCELDISALSRSCSKTTRFLADLNAPAMEAVLATAPRSHALTLKHFFYEYLEGNAMIGVMLPVSILEQILFKHQKLGLTVWDLASRISSFYFPSTYPILQLGEQQEIAEGFQDEIQWRAFETSLRSSLPVRGSTSGRTPE
jgi:hypothetical protein